MKTPICLIEKEKSAKDRSASGGKASLPGKLVGYFYLCRDLKAKPRLISDKTTNQNDLPLVSDLIQKSSQGAVRNACWHFLRY